MEPKAFRVLGKDSTTDLQPQASVYLPLSLFFSPLSLQQIPLPNPSPMSMPAYKIHETKLLWLTRGWGRRVNSFTGPKDSEESWLTAPESICEGRSSGG